MAKGNKPKLNMNDMMAQVGRMQEQLKQAQESLVDETVEASAGGGVIKIVMTGTQVCKSVEVAAHLMEEGDIEMLQDLIMLAVNQALLDSQALAAERLGPITGGLGIG
jgi:nucleoid-associated protein EbfC